MALADALRRTNENSRHDTMNIRNYGEQDFETPNTWSHIHYLTVPIAVGTVLSGLIMIAALSARFNARCEIALPWDLDTALAIVRYLRPIALQEIAFLSRESSRCVADLHAYVVSGYAATLCVSLILVAASLPFSKFNDLKVSKRTRGNYLYYIKFWVGIAILCSFLTYIAFFQYDLIIPKDGRRFRPGFDGIYTDVASYWFLTWGAMCVAAFALSAAVLAVVWTRRLKNLTNGARG